jgi:ankyrin repeat protein
MMDSIGMSNVCLLLAQHGADVNAHDSLGMTPLHVAVNTFHPTECVTLVSELGADVNAVDHNGHSPLFIAVSQNAVDMVSFLLQSGATLKAGCSVDSSDNDGATSLHFAAARNHVEVCSLLISAKADVNSLVTTDQVKK